MSELNKPNIHPQKVLSVLHVETLFYNTVTKQKGTRKSLNKYDEHIKIEGRTYFHTDRITKKQHTHCRVVMSSGNTEPHHCNHSGPMFVS